MNGTADRFQSETEIQVVLICCVCQGDGVLQIGGNWYCLNHLDDGFIATARVIARMRGHDEADAAARAADMAPEL